MSKPTDDLPEDLDPSVKELLMRREALTNEELDRELADLELLYCTTKCPKQNSHRMCIKTTGHLGTHYCPNHGNFSQFAADYFEPLWMFDRSLALDFNIVIGNPPYGATISDKAKTYFNANYRFQDYQLDTYLLFMERGVSLLRPIGIQCLIVPNTWLPSVMLKSIRKMVFSNSQVLSLVDVQDTVLSAVGVSD